MLAAIMATERTSSGGRLFGGVFREDAAEAGPWRNGQPREKSVFAAAIEEYFGEQGSQRRQSLAVRIVEWLFSRSIHIKPIRGCCDECDRVHVDNSSSGLLVFGNRPDEGKSCFASWVTYVAAVERSLDALRSPWSIRLRLNFGVLRTPSHVLLPLLRLTLLVRSSLGCTVYGARAFQLCEVQR